MSLISKATSGAILRPQIVTIYGPNGVGKSTLAAKFPKCLMLDLEDGSGAIAFKGFMRLGKTLIPDLDTYLSVLADVQKDNQGFETLVTDSVEALESLIHRHLCKVMGVDSIEDIPYGKGNVLARENMEEIMHIFQKIRDTKKMSVILVGHSIQKAFNDPAKNVSYDRHIMRANEKFAAIIKDLSDAIYFVNHRVLTEVNKQNPAKAKAFTTNERTIFTTWSHAHDAKSRFQLDSEINFSLVSIEEAVLKLMPHLANETADDLVHVTKQMRMQILDKELGEKIDKTIKEAGTDVAKLRAIKSRLSEVLQTA